MEEYPHFVVEPLAMVERLLPLKPLVGAEELKLWEQLASQGQVAALFERVLQQHYDPSYRRSSRRSSPRTDQQALDLTALDAAAMDEAASLLVARLGALQP